MWSRENHTQQNRESVPQTVTQLPCCVTHMDVSDEILLNIFAHLNARDVLCCSCVCRLWNAVAADDWLWQQFFQTHWPIRFKRVSASIRSDSWKVPIVTHTHTTDALAQARAFTQILNTHAQHTCTHTASKLVYAYTLHTHSLSF